MAEEKLLTRQEAAKLLRVSTRTIDRYIADQRISIVRDQGRTMLRKSELLNMQDARPLVGQVVRDISLREEEDSSSKYKVLYEDAKDQIEKRDELLRHMHYQLGKLETEAQNTVPLLVSENKQKELEGEISFLQSENSSLKERLSSAKAGRIVFFSIAFISMVLLFLSLVV